MNVEFGEMMELDTVSGEMRVMYCANCQAESEDGNWYSFDFVPLTGEVVWDYNGYDELPSDLWIAESEICCMAHKANIKAYYLGSDGRPFIARELINGSTGYKYYSFFNEFEGYFGTEMDRFYQFDYIEQSKPISYSEYLDAVMRRYI